MGGQSNKWPMGHFAHLSNNYHNKISSSYGLCSKMDHAYNDFKMFSKYSFVKHWYTLTGSLKLDDLIEHCSS